MSRVFIVFLPLFFMLFALEGKHKERVFVFTDINIDAGDPDDRQSLIHLFWYANDLQIEGIVPDRWEAKGLEACQLVVDEYAKDYKTYNFRGKDYPRANKLKKVIAKDVDHAAKLFISAASKEESPLYVLIWGNMKLFKSILLTRPALSKNIRLITIGTGLMMERDIEYMPPNWKKSAPCQQLNWNGFGRNEIYEHPLFDKMWWVEMNWTYAGMFSGNAPKQLFEQLSSFGHLGQHIKEVVKKEDWAQYFRAGDTPSLLYVLDNQHDLNDPTQSSWAGKFVKPFPIKRPNYYTDYSKSIEWDYDNPCNTWQNHQAVQQVAIETLAKEREEMYAALLDKLGQIYED